MHENETIDDYEQESVDTDGKYIRRPWLRLATDALLASPRLTERQRRVAFVILKWFKGHERSSFPSALRIAHETGYSRRAVRDVLAEICLDPEADAEGREILFYRAAGSQGRGNASRFFPNWRWFRTADHAYQELHDGPISESLIQAEKRKEDRPGSRENGAPNTPFSETETITPKQLLEADKMARSDAENGVSGSLKWRVSDSKMARSSRHDSVRDSVEGTPLRDSGARASDAHQSDPETDKSESKPKRRFCAGCGERLPPGLTSGRRYCLTCSPPSGEPIPKSTEPPAELAEALMAEIIAPDFRAVFHARPDNAAMVVAATWRAQLADRLRSEGYGSRAAQTAAQRLIGRLQIERRRARRTREAAQ